MAIRYNRWFLIHNMPKPPHSTWEGQKLRTLLPTSIRIRALIDNFKMAALYKFYTAKSARHIIVLYTVENSYKCMFTTSVNKASVFEQSDPCSKCQYHPFSLFGSSLASLAALYLFKSLFGFLQVNFLDTLDVWDMWAWRYSWMFVGLWQGQINFELTPYYNICVSMA